LIDGVGAKTKSNQQDFRRGRDMTTTKSGYAEGLPDLHHKALRRKVGAPPLVFPTTLAGSLPAAERQHRDSLQQVHAIDAVITFLTRLRRTALRPTQSWQAVREALFPVRAGFHGRMDLIARVTARAKDFVNRLATGRFGLTAAVPRSEA
jgi:hypothetical protein